MILISNDFWLKMYNFDSYNVLLVIATNIAVLLMTASVLHAHIFIYLYINITQDYPIQTNVLHESVNTVSGLV